MVSKGQFVDKDEKRYKRKQQKKRHNAALEAGFVCPLCLSLHGGQTGPGTQSVIPSTRR